MAELGDTNYFIRIGTSILDSVAAALVCANIEVPERKFVGFDDPPQDCCPELVAWIGNVRPWDGNFPDSMREGRFLCFNSWAFDVSIRIGRCYVDSDENGEGLAESVLQDWATILYNDMQAIYMGWVWQWKNNAVSELSSCEPMIVGPLTTYNEGGCAGSQFTITVGAL